MSEYSMAKAQRMYDNQTPPEPPEIPDELFDEYLETKECIDWVEENRGGRDEVEFIEMNYDTLYDMCVEWLDQQKGGER